jgi:AcrR family transcriptional regulator
MRRAEKRDHLVDTAMQLFCRRGYHGTGIDQILAEAGIAKTTLYRHFESKDELIVAALAKTDELARDELRAYVERASDDPRQRLLATFGQLDIWLKDGAFNGCPFVAAAGEFGDEKSPVFLQARLHKRLYLAYFEELVRAARLPDPKRLAAQIVMLHEGALAFAQLLGANGAADTARDAAERLIEAAEATKTAQAAHA